MGFLRDYPLVVKVLVTTTEDEEQRPTSVERDGKYHRVLQIVDQWKGKDRRFFKVKLSGDSELILIHNLTNNAWELRYPKLHVVS
jgi:hypothetical protein